MTPPFPTFYNAHHALGNAVGASYPMLRPKVRADSQNLRGSQFCPFPSTISHSNHRK